MVAIGVANMARTAAAVRYRFSGEVTAVAPELAAEFSVGETLRGRVWINANPRPPCSICIGDTYDTSHIRATIGGDYLLTSPEGALTIINDFGGSLDIVQHGTTSPLGLSGPTVNGHIPDYFSLNLRYDDGLTSNELLPQFAPANFDQSYLRFDIDDDLSIDFRLDDFSVPEPNALALTALILSSLLFRRRRRSE